jgi:two-component system chemotaxis response regulator CheB
LGRGAKENGHRPAIDPLFRSAAQVYGNRVVGVLLSGVLDDGTAGMLAVKMRGGVTIAQNPDEALYGNMPRSAIENVGLDRILSVSEIGATLVHLAGELVAEEEVAPVSDEMEIESNMAELDSAAMHSLERPGKSSAFACPDCGSVLWELNDANLIRFRCRTGHAFAAGSLLANQSEAIEEALWSALRALEENASLTSRMAKRLQKRNQQRMAKRFEEQTESAQQRAEIIRQVLLNGINGVDEKATPEEA